MRRLSLEEKVSQMRCDTAAIPRLGIPAYSHRNECLHGLANGTATVFPQAIGMAATWDAPLIGAEADAIATEARAKHNDYAATHDGQSASLRPELLYAEYQHLSRPALGPRAGNLRRRPLPDGANRRRLHSRLAGQRSPIRQDPGLRETLRSPQRARIRKASF